MARLTDISVRSLPSPASGAKVYPCESITGFGLRVTSAGARAFVLTLPGMQRQRVTLGKAGVLALKDARQLARERLAELTLGKHRPKRIVFVDAVALFVGEKRKKNKARTIDENERILKKYCASLHRKNLEDITTHDITKITDKLSKTPGTALHTFWALRTFLRWCAKRSYLDRNPIERLEAPHPTKFRDRVLSDEELRAVWKSSDGCGQFGNIVKLLIVTGQRRSEIGSLKAEWCSLPSSRDGGSKITPAPIAVGGEDTDCEVMMGGSTGCDHADVHGMGRFNSYAARHQCTITIPSELSKNKRAHTFPISALSVRLITGATNSRSPVSGYIFLSGTDTSKPFSGWSKCKTQLDRKVPDHLRDPTKEIQPWTLHDLRRTYATNLQRLGIKLEVIEALLNHISGTRAGIVGVYNRHRYEAEMREAVNIFETWFARTIINA